MTIEIFAGIAGAVLAALFKYIPKLRDWYYAFDSNVQRVLMIIFLLLVAGGVYGLSCTPILDYVSCDTEGIWTMVEVFFLAAAGNQATYLLAPVNRG